MSKNKNILNPNMWVKLHADYLYNFALSRVSKIEIAKDLVQETFFAGLKSKDNFLGKASERTWLVSILKRKVIDYYRKINSIKGKAEVRMSFYSNGKREGNWIEERVPNNWNEEATNDLEKEELGIVLHQCIDNLPEKYAVVFRMKTMQQMETEDVCKDLGISASNLWVLIHRARIQLRACMEKNWFNY